jgi:hypothetical protein
MTKDDQQHRKKRRASRYVTAAGLASDGRVDPHAESWPMQNQAV